MASLLALEEKSEVSAGNMLFPCFHSPSHYLYGTARHGAASL